MYAYPKNALFGAWKASVCDQAASFVNETDEMLAVSCCEAMNGVLYLWLSRGSVSVAQLIQKQNPRNLGPIAGAMLFNVGLNVSHEGPASRSMCQSASV